MARAYFYDSGALLGVLVDLEGAVDEGEVGDARDKVLGVEAEVVFVPRGDGLEGRKRRNGGRGRGGRGRRGMGEEGCGLRNGGCAAVSGCPPSEDERD